MNSAPRWPLAIVALSAVCVVGALAWATVAVVRLEERERHSQADSAFEESVRLALWRIDSALTPLIAREAGRPYFQYQSFYPADRPYSAMPAEPHAGDVLVLPRDFQAPRARQALRRRRVGAALDPRHERARRQGGRQEGRCMSVVPDGSAWTRVGARDNADLY